MSPETNAAEDSASDSDSAGLRPRENANIPFYSQRNQYGVLIASALVVLASISMNIEGSDRVRVLGLPELPQMCQFRNLFGIPCPGCGMTRAFVSMGHFEFANAWNYNSVGVFFYLFVVFQIPFRAVQIFRHRKGLSHIQLGSAPQWVWGFLVVAALVQWIQKLMS